MYLFIQSFLENNYTDLRLKLAIVLIMWLFVTIAMSADLLAGWRKAKERGEVRSSYGLRRTVNKAVMYYALMLFAFMFDCIGMFFYPHPYITLIATAFLIFIEGKSIFEKANEKDRRRFNDSANTLATILDNRNDLVDGIVEVLKQKLQKEKEENNGKTNA